MSWAKLDDRYDDNRKIKRAWRRDRAAVGLHVMAITYCCRHRTNGLVDIEWVEERLPAARERERAIGVLVDLGLFERLDDEHWLVHDYLDYNHSREERDGLSDAGRKAALARWGKRGASGRHNGSHSDPQCDPLCDSHTEPNSSPVPSHTNSLRGSGGMGLVGGDGPPPVGDGFPGGRVR